MKESNPLGAGFGGPPATIAYDPVLLLVLHAQPDSALIVLQVEQPTRGKTSDATHD
jgi:hypothetical protein